MSQWLDEHRELIGLAAEDLRRHGVKETVGEGLPAESVLRCALLKQHRQLSYEELAFHLEDSASFRAFARLPLSWTPKKSVLQNRMLTVAGDEPPTEGDPPRPRRPRAARRSDAPERLVRTSLAQVRDHRFRRHRRCDHRPRNGGPHFILRSLVQIQLKDPFTHLPTSRLRACSLVHRFRNSNHIRRPGRACRTKYGRRGVG